jgi:FkbM family methyltransferase
MKAIIKKVLGDFLIYHLSNLKNKIKPGPYYIKEKQMIERCREFYSTFIFQGDLCFDVGANFGNRVEPLLKIQAKVIAIEPQIKCIKYLRRKFGKKITIIANGLGNKEELKDFYTSNSTTISSFSKQWIDSVKDNRFREFKWKNTGKLEITTLDKLILKFGIPVFIKIDVEGYELEVLEGLTSSIKMISFEYTVPEQTSRTILCIERLAWINPNSRFNYSTGDSMRLSLRDWVDSKEMISIVNGKEFINTGGGDIYMKSQ